MTNDETTTSTFACGINQSLLDALCSKTGPAAAIVREVHGHNSRDVREEFYASAAVSRLTHIVTLGNALRNRDGAARVYEVGDGEERKRDRETSLRNLERVIHPPTAHESKDVVRDEGHEVELVPGGRAHGRPCQNHERGEEELADRRRRPPGAKGGLDEQQEHRERCQYNVRLEEQRSRLFPAPHERGYDYRCDR